MFVENFSPGDPGEDDCGAVGFKGGTGVLYCKRRVNSVTRRYFRGILCYRA